MRREHRLPAGRVDKCGTGRWAAGPIREHGNPDGTGKLARGQRRDYVAETFGAGNKAAGILRNRAHLPAKREVKLPVLGDRPGDAPEYDYFQGTTVFRISNAAAPGTGGRLREGAKG